MQGQFNKINFDKLGNCLVIGGGGFLGAQIVKQLSVVGTFVRAFGRSEYPALLSAGVPCIKGDICELPSLLDALTEVDTVFHTASLCHMWGKKTLLQKVNVEGSRNVLEACLQKKVKRLVYTSSPSVVIGEENIINGDESLPYPEKYNAEYPRTKSQAEQLLLKANGTKHHNSKTNILTCAIRPHLLWGPGDPHILPRIRKTAESGRLRQIGDGQNQITITQVENAAHAHILAALELTAEARCAGKAYFVGDEEPIYLWTWLNELLAIWGLPKIKKRAPWSLARYLAKISEWLHTHFTFLGEPFMTTFIVDQLVRSHSFSHKAAEKDFNYKPIVSPQEGLEKLMHD